MQEQFKYIVDGKVVDRKDFNKLFKNKYIHIEGDNIYAVDFSSVSNFFDGDFKSSRQINDHVKDILDLGQIKGSSTRHKSQNGETHTKTCIEIIKEKQDKYYPFLRVNFQVGENGSEGCKVYTNFHTINEVKEYMKDTDYTHYFVYDINGKKISWGSVNKDSKNNQISAEQNKTEENLVFQKDSEIHKDDVITKISRGEKETIEYLKPSIVSELGEELHFDKDFNLIKSGVKETNGKTDYSEIDWDFIEGLAKRMNKNKEKYEPFNYHKPMDVNLLKQSLLRHIIEILKGEHNDAGQEYGHLFAVSLNSMMIYYQLKNNS